MLEPFGPLLIHMSPALLMGTLLLVNLTVRRGRDGRREAAEARRMAMALEVELRSLRDSYDENLNLIAAGSPFLVSTRGAGAMYRCNMGRLLTALNEAALAPVVTAFAHQQRLEAYLGASTKPNGPGGVRVLPRQTPLQELKRYYADGCRLIEAAISVLDGVEPAPLPVSRPLPRLRQALGWHGYEGNS